MNDFFKPVLLIGEQGTAKTVIIQSYMGRYNAEEHTEKTVNFSSATTPNMVQRIIQTEQKHTFDQIDTLF